MSDKSCSEPSKKKKSHKKKPRGRFASLAGRKLKLSDPHLFFSWWGPLFFWVACASRSSLYILCIQTKDLSLHFYIADMSTEVAISVPAPQATEKPKGMRKNGTSLNVDLSLYTKYVLTLSDRKAMARKQKRISTESRELIMGEAIGGKSGHRSCKGEGEGDEGREGGGETGMKSAIHNDRYRLTQEIEENTGYKRQTSCKRRKGAI